MLFGAWMWPGYVLLDVFLKETVYPQANLWRLIAIRLVGEALLVAGYLLSSRKKIRIRGSLFLCVFVCLMALDLGGLNSMYLHDEPCPE